VFSPGGELYIAEEITHRIRKINKDGIISLVAGTGIPGFSGEGGPAHKAQLKSPYRLVFDKEGKITTLAGNSNIGWMQDGLEVRITVHNFP
jgi:hypothetical protein